MPGAARHHLAQIKVARASYPLDDPGMTGFVGQLDRINALAELAPGFVWRLQDDSGDATGLSPFDDPMIIVNLSVWPSPEALFDFVYRSAHNEVMRRRKSLVRETGAGAPRVVVAPARRDPEHRRRQGPARTSPGARPRPRRVHAQAALSTSRGGGMRP